MEKTIFEIVVTSDKKLTKEDKASFLNNFYYRLLGYGTHVPEKLEKSSVIIKLKENE